MNAVMPRGIRNNNPGNIRWKDEWKGLVPLAHRTDPSFCQFITPAYGLRAMSRILTRYYQVYGLRSIAAIIHRWAPTSENDTEDYIKHVSKLTRLEPRAVFALSDTVLCDLIAAIVMHENGMQPYAHDAIMAAIRMRS